jgi:thiosulfate/3-mercaptopyruvate sulfurtransferase
VLDGGYKARGPMPANGECRRKPSPRWRAASLPSSVRNCARKWQEVEQAIASDTNLIDARSVAQFIGKEKTQTVKTLGTVPTSVNVNFDKFYHADKPGFASKEEVAALTKAASVSDEKGIITFCNTGHLASIAWFGLSEVEGLKNVRLYDGSMSEWTADPARPVTVN